MFVHVRGKRKSALAIDVEALVDRLVRLGREPAPQGKLGDRSREIVSAYRVQRGVESTVAALSRLWIR